MAVEVRNRLVFWIEEILRVERRVAVKLEPGPVHGIGARPCHRVDDASGRSSEFGRVRVCEHLKFKNRFDAEQYAGRRARRLVVHVIDVGAIEQEAVLLGSRTVDGNLGGPAADDIVPRGQCRRHAGLQQRKLLKRSAVESLTSPLTAPDVVLTSGASAVTVT